MANFKNLTDNQAAVFEQIALNNDASDDWRSLKALVNKGLIERQVEKLTGLLPPTYIYHYDVPLAVHVEWCQWCDEQGVE